MDERWMDYGWVVHDGESIMDEWIMDEYGESSMDR
jgi:hypothetical protein